MYKRLALLFCVVGYLAIRSEADKPPNGIGAVVVYDTSSVVAVPRNIGNPSVVVCGDLDVAEGQEIRLKVMFKSEPGFVGTLYAHNPFLNPRYYVPASVMIFSSDHRKLTDLAVSKDPKSAAKEPVSIYRSRAAGRTFLIPTGKAKDALFALPPGDYFVEATYFDSILTGSTESNEVLCKSKLQPIKVR